MSAFQVIRRWSVATGITASCSALTYVGALFAEGAPTYVRILIGIGGAILITLSVFIPAREVSRQQIARRAAEDLCEAAVAEERTVLEDLLAPAVSLLGEVISAPTTSTRSTYQQQMKQLVVDLAAEKIGPPRTRACLLELLPGPPRTVQCNSVWKGRNSKLYLTFREGLNDGSDSIVAVAEHRGAVYIEDVDDPDICFPTGADFKTFMAVTVWGGTKSYGCLSIDAEQAGALSATEQVLLRILAEILGAALSR
ncbi:MULTISPECIES: GAF domain-containing protein [Streptomyces]|uniref:GAF domain-containing protein n=1 Tax=Streptomyces TaxID=1883 RepID=UPI00200D0FBE|nr:GAF domain-containing protein [Streptomyces sp. LRE541]UPZ30943.1 GAF domain-containing protein [Streptomyces sp. LRE541]